MKRMRIRRRLFKERDRLHSERWDRMSSHTRAEIVAGIFPLEDFTRYGPLPKGFGQGG